jgi:CubicO group peptidase (beta-lactamase class C family)
MTKNLVCFTLMSLAVDKFIPEFPSILYVSGTTLQDLKTEPLKTKPTIRHCITHTAGLSAY